MTQDSTTSRFKAKLLRPAAPGDDASWAFVILPKDASEKLPRRGRTTIDGTINGYRFQATLEPDGQLSHWLRVSGELREAAGADVGDDVMLEIAPAQEESEPDIPPDFLAALADYPEARAVWDSTTTIARVDWIHWIASTKQAKTRALRISNACDMLASGKRRVCCFDQSGYYSKAFSAPKPA
ncbi:MAG: YdeI/OmpD-associated family protein [Pseudomonadota bacterium]|nr:YdeI/OmpD-associated family protein [Pseudomonadota bacterium]